MILLAGFAEAVISIVTGLMTAMIIGIVVFLLSFKTSLAVMMEKLNNIDTRFASIEKDWERRFGEQTKTVDEIKEQLRGKV